MNEGVVVNLVWSAGRIIAVHQPQADTTEEGVETWNRQEPPIMTRNQILAIRDHDDDHERLMPSLKFLEVSFLKPTAKNLRANPKADDLDVTRTMEPK